MNLTAASGAFYARLAEVDNLLAHIRALEGISESPLLAVLPVYSAERNIAAGLSLVLMYGALEHGVTSAVREAIQAIAAHNVLLRDFEQPFYAVALSPEFDAARDGLRRRWEIREKLLERQLESAPCTINDAVFDNDLQVTRQEVLAQIFRAFGIRSSPVPNPACGGYIEDVKDRRNEIAHGRESAMAIGGQFSHGALMTRRDAVRDAVTHFITTIEGWGTAKEYVKMSERANY